MNHYISVLTDDACSLTLTAFDLSYFENYNKVLDLIFHLGIFLRWNIIRLSRRLAQDLIPKWWNICTFKSMGIPCLREVTIFYLHDKFENNTSKLQLRHIAALIHVNTFKLTLRTISALESLPGPWSHILISEFSNFKFELYLTFISSYIGGLLNKSEILTQHFWQVTYMYLIIFKSLFFSQNLSLMFLPFF